MVTTEVHPQTVTHQYLFKAEAFLIRLTVFFFLLKLNLLYN